VLAQQSTETPTTPTPQPGSLFITVTNSPEGVNVRTGPSAAVYPSVGHLNPGDTAPAHGKSPGGDWVQIEYAAAPNGKGWVYAPYVAVSGGVLQIVEPPPTPAPPATPTIDPTLAAQFNAIPTATRLPTFTPAPAVTMPVYTELPDTAVQNQIPMAGVIISLGAVGLLGLLFSLYSRPGRW
jgi:hypothetical protein